MFQPLPNPLSPLFLCALRSALPFPPRDPLCPPLSFSCPSLLKIAGDFSSLSPLQKKDFRTQNTKKNPYFRESNRIEIESKSKLNRNLHFSFRFRSFIPPDIVFSSHLSLCSSHVSLRLTSPKANVSPPRGQTTMICLKLSPWHVQTKHEKHEKQTKFSDNSSVKKLAIKRSPRKPWKRSSLPSFLGFHFQF